MPLWKRGRTLITGRRQLKRKRKERSFSTKFSIYIQHGSQPTQYLRGFQEHDNISEIREWEKTLESRKHIQLIFFFCWGSNPSIFFLWWTYICLHYSSKWLQTHTSFHFNSYVLFEDACLAQVIMNMTERNWMLSNYIKTRSSNILSMHSSISTDDE